MNTIREKIHFCQNALRNETIRQQFGVTEDAIADIWNSRFLQPIIVSLHGIREIGTAMFDAMHTQAPRGMQQAVCLVRELITVIGRIKPNLHFSAYMCVSFVFPYFAQTPV